MATSTVACCNAIVPELLNKNNYKDWSSRVKTYLLAEDLWDVIKGKRQYVSDADVPDADEAENKALMLKNAKALHAINISCATEMFSFIREIDTAREAWEVLEKECNLRLKEIEESSQKMKKRKEKEERERHERDTIMEEDTDAGQARDEEGIHIKSVFDTQDISMNDPSLEEDQHIMNLIPSVMRLFRRILKGLPKLLGINDIYEMKLKHCQILEILKFMSKETAKEDLTPDQLGIVQKSVSQAIEKGHVEFVTHIVKANQSFLYIPKESIEANIFFFAVESRQEKIYSLIYGFPKIKRSEFGLERTNNGINMLHSVGSSLLSQFNHIQDASLKMQRALQWFKEVESIVPAEAHDFINDSRLTARELFTVTHKNLKVEAEKSMKGTATSCTVVGALIVTMMFAVAFTVPGGSKGETGIPVFIDKKLFIVFIVSDIISLISSTTSVIIFLGILTSRYAEDDFLKSLPTKMMIGLFTLFLAIATMMVTFSSGLIIMLHGKYSWILLQSILVASVPVSSFVWMQFPLLIDTFISTYGSGIFDRKVKPWC